MEYPPRPEGSVAEQIEQLWTLIWRLCEQGNLLEERMERMERASAQEAG